MPLLAFNSSFPKVGWLPPVFRGRSQIDHVGPAGGEIGGFVDVLSWFSVLFWTKRPSIGIWYTCHVSYVSSSKTSGIQVKSRRWELILFEKNLIWWIVVLHLPTPSTRCFLVVLNDKGTFWIFLEGPGRKSISLALLFVFVKQPFNLRLNTLNQPFSKRAEHARRLQKDKWKKPTRAASINRHGEVPCNMLHHMKDSSLLQPKKTSPSTKTCYSYISHLSTGQAAKGRSRFIQRAH